MCASLCDTVLERDDSAQMLEQLERQNLFVVALDHQRRWFRYHHLFREMLQAELERREPELPFDAQSQSGRVVQCERAAGGGDRVLGRSGRHR